MADSMDNCDGAQYDPFAETMPQDNNQNNQAGGDNFTERSRSRSPIRKRSRSRSSSPRDWKPRSDRNDRNRDKGNRDRRSGGGSGGNQKRLYISNIPYELRWQDLKDLFRDKVGEVTYVELYESAEGKPCGSGIIEFKDKDIATKAIEVMHKYDIKGRKVVVREERESDRRRHARQLNQNSDMDGGGMGGGMRGGGMGGGGGGMGGGGGGGGGGMGGNSGRRDREGSFTTDSGRRQREGSYSSDMGGGMGGGGMNMNTGIPGITPQMLNQLGIEGPVTSQIFIANLDYKVTAKKIRDIFKMAGSIQNAELKEDKDGKSRGMAIVQFEHPIEAVQAISMFNGQILFDRAMSVRMDKMADQNQPVAAPRLPSGLKTIGMGLGSNGLPLSNITQLSQSLLQLNSICGGGMGGGNMSGGGNMGGGGTMGGGGGGNMGGGGAMGGNMGGNMGGMASSNMGNMGSMGGMNSMSPNMGGNMSGGMGAGGMGGGMGFGGDMLGGGGMGTQMGMTSNMGTGMVGGMAGGMTTGMAGGMGGMTGQNTGMAGGMAGGMRGGMDTMGLGSMSTNTGMDNFNMGNNQMGGMAGGMGLMGMGGQNTGMGPNSMMRNNGNTTKSRNIDMDNSTVFVRNLPFTYTWQNLKEKFRHIGDVKYAAIRMENNRSKGCGVVRFISQEEARRAISMMNGARIEGREIEVRMDQRN